MTGPADILRRLGEAGPSDRDLVARFAGQRDQAAFAELVRRHGPLVLGVCRRVTGHAEDAEDAFQAVFLVLAQNAGRITRPDLLGNWLYGVSVRVASRARRSAVRRRAREVAVSLLPDPPAEPRATLAELGPILDEELAALPEWYREAILLCDLRGVSREEAATLLGVPEGTLSSRLANGRKKLAERLARRGVPMSVAGLVGMVGQTQAGMSVSNELLTKTSGLVADWSAGGPIPGPIIRLTEGGFAVRQTLLIGVLVVAVAAGAVVAAGLGKQDLPGEPPKPTSATKGGPLAQGKGAENAAERVEFTTQPKMRVARDHKLSDVRIAIWTPDGHALGFQGIGILRGTSLKGEESIIDKGNAVQMDYRLFEPIKVSVAASQRFLGNNQSFVGFTPDGKFLVTEQREHELVSGNHRLHFTPLDRPLKDIDVSKEAKTMAVKLDASDTHGYAFASDGKTFRTIAFEREGSGAPKKIEVREVDAATGKTRKSLMKVDYTQHVLSTDGKRLATFDKNGKVTVYDVDRGAKLSAHALPESPLLPPMAGTAGASFGGNFGQGGSQPPSQSSFLAFSPDASKLVVSRTIGQTVVIDTQTGKPLPALEGSEMMETYPAPHSFTGDGRLLAMTGLHYTIQKTTVRGGFAPKGGREQEMLSPGRRFLTVWDTQTGKVLKSWDRSPLVAFNPVRPVLAILEPNGENTTRLGLWDFSAEVEKK
jgi:RNA polymerase sigma factor (sigma-70 family)